jgi:hypothetical protein
MAIRRRRRRRRRRIRRRVCVSNCIETFYGL